MVFCTKCGLENQNEDKFCYNCGAKLTQTNAVEDTNKQTYSNSNKNVNYQHAEKQSDKKNHENENVNYQHTEKSLTKRNKPKKFKHFVISILDAITNASPFFALVIMVGFIISFIISFIDQQLSQIIWYASGFSIIILIIMATIPSAISNRLKRRRRLR